MRIAILKIRRLIWLRKNKSLKTYQKRTKGIEKDEEKCLTRPLGEVIS